MVRLNPFKMARLRAGLTQQELAKRLGVSESLVAKWETQRSFPTSDMLVALARELEADPATLFEREE